MTTRTQRKKIKRMDKKIRKELLIEGAGPNSENIRIDLTSFTNGNPDEIHEVIIPEIKKLYEDLLWDLKFKNGSEGLIVNFIAKEG